MPTTTEIYGLQCSIPDQPPTTRIDGNKLPVKKQKFRRVDWAAEIGDTDKDAEGRSIYTDEQRKFIDKEFEKCTSGHWFMNNGNPTYITGMYYYYLTYWKLENNVYPEYRESDRLFYIFFQECYDDPLILGICRLKNRRLGATSMGTSISVYIATFNSEMYCGNVSQTDDDVEKLFLKMTVPGFLKLPEYLRPRVDNSSTYKKKLHFIETPKRGKAKELRTIEGLNSVIDFEATTLGAYDGSRLSFCIIDESGKWRKVNINSYLSVVKECVSEGARKVGFLYFPTTVNPPKEGGKNFKEFWDTTDHFTFGRGATPKGIVRYFQPSWECLGGFVDEYGYSVIDPPDKRTLEYLAECQLKFEAKKRIPIDTLRKGAKQYLKDQYAGLTTEEDRDDFKRKFPFKETDSFSFGATHSPFNITKVQEQIEYLRLNPVPLRRGTLFMGFDKKVEFSDDVNGKWLIYKLPENPNEVDIDVNRNTVTPLNWHRVIGGVDTFKFDKTVSLGSMGVICIGSQFNQADPESGEIYAIYEGRPPLTELFWREMMYAAVWYGCKLVVENDASREYEKYFKNVMGNVFDMNCVGFLHRTPDAVIDTSKASHYKKRFDIGVASRDTFAFNTEIAVAQTYIEKYVHKINFPALLEEFIIFDIDDRTKADKTIAFMMWLLGLTGETKARKTETQPDRFIEMKKVYY